MRGKVCVEQHKVIFGGITPACAGKREAMSVDPDRIRDHPRVCGEKRLICLAVLWLCGSPPRVRGKGSGDGKAVHAPGITPACAGKRKIQRSGCIASQDHPRVCGEKRFLNRGESIQGGSPPRVRGKGVITICCVIHYGITPACAGKSKRLASCAQSAEDHPRVCGEKEAGALSEVYETGSPPRVRGKGGRGPVRSVRDRITPACAGKRSSHAPRACIYRDHPRVCGEKAL